MVTELELAYVGGFFDGEGYVGVIKVRPSIKWGQKSPTYSLVVSVGNTNLEILRWLKSLFGGSIFVTNDETKEWQKGHEWRIVANQALSFLRLIYPYVKIKRNQIKLAIFFQEVKGHKPGGRKPISKVNLDLYEAIKIELEGMKRYAKQFEAVNQ